MRGLRSRYRAWRQCRAEYRRWVRQMKADLALVEAGIQDVLEAMERARLVLEAYAGRSLTA